MSRLSPRERFWQLGSYVVIGQGNQRDFPLLTYRALKRSGKVVIPVDPQLENVDGDPCFSDLAHLPHQVDGAILEVPKSETLVWVQRIVNAKIPHLWIHMGGDTPEAIALAQAKELQVHYGTCAVMYLTPGLTYHSIHKWIMRTCGKY